MMHEELAALRVGYLHQELRYRQRTAWAASLRDVEDVDHILDKLEKALLGLSGAMSDSQWAEFRKLKDRLSNRCQLLLELRVPEPPDETTPDSPLQLKPLPADEARLHQRWQDEDWAALRDLLAAVVGRKGRRAVYHEIGDHVGECVFGLLSGVFKVPLSGRYRSYVLGGIDKLPSWERPSVRVHLPDVDERKATAWQAAIHLRSSYGGLCKALEEGDIEAEAEGPIRPGVFRVNNVVYAPFQRKQWKLLWYLWHRGTMTIERAIRCVYGQDADQVSSAIVTLYKKVNLRFRKLKCPAHITAQGGRFELKITRRS